jgi:hypothetical protein
MRRLPGSKANPALELRRRRSRRRPDGAVRSRHRRRKSSPPKAAHSGIWHWRDDLTLALTPRIVCRCNTRRSNRNRRYPPRHNSGRHRQALPRWRRGGDWLPNRRGRLIQSMDGFPLCGRTVHRASVGAPRMPLDSAISRVRGTLRFDTASDRKTGVASSSLAGAGSSGWYIAPNKKRPCASHLPLLAENRRRSKGAVPSGCISPVWSPTN